MTGYCTVCHAWYTSLAELDWHQAHCQPERTWCRRHQSYRCDCRDTRHGSGSTTPASRERSGP